MGGGVFVNNTAFRGTWEQQFKKKKGNNEKNNKRKRRHREGRAKGRDVETASSRGKETP